MSVLLYLLTAFMRFVVFVLKFFGGGGTALPGLWIEKYTPWIISAYTTKYSQIILITGTNGKTTTQLLIRHALLKQGIDIVSNTSGSNMFRGIATTIVSNGVPISANSVLLLEVEEGTMPKIAPYIRPHKVIITNFYRDQLDAYGELSKTVEYVRGAVLAWPDAKLYMNCDDIHIHRAVEGARNQKKTFSMGGYAKDFLYEGSSTATEVDIVCKRYTTKDDFSTEGDLYVTQKNETISFSLLLPGEYNIYNFMAAMLVCVDLALSERDFIQAIGDMDNPFGRGEKILVGSSVFRIFLIKNPAGMSQVCNMVKSKLHASQLIVALNDNIADGRDVSWIWDVRLDCVSTKEEILFTGSRAYDMAIRYKYAGFSVSEANINTNIYESILKLTGTQQVEKEYIVLATYTAMNQIRAALSKSVKIEKFG